jgi:hypothetical protein
VTSGRGPAPARRISRLVLRTEQGPLRRLWRLLYAAATRLVATALCAREPGAGVFVRRTMAAGDPVYGLSDVDLVVVVAGDSTRPGAARERVWQRWRGLRARFPPLGDLFEVSGYEDLDLLRAVQGSPAALFRLHRPPGTEPAADSLSFAARPFVDDAGLTIRPGLYGPTADWRLVRGVDRRPPVPPVDAARRRLAVWAELQYWWRNAFALCLEPERPDAAHLAFKLVAESARAWLWLVHGEEVASRRAALERLRRVLPAEAETASEMLALHRALPRRPEPPLGAALSALLRTTRRVADVLAGEVRGAGSSSVALVAATPVAPPPAALAALAARPVPLLDWRAVVVPPRHGETLAVVSGRADEPAALAALARLDGTRDHPAVADDRLLVLPAAGPRPTRFRAVQCAATDPVSFALTGGAESAAFPALPGLSARDWARRAVAEHAGWLRHGDLGSPAARGMLLSAARAAVLAESTREGAPVLPLDDEATGALLARGEPAAGSAFRDALAGGSLDGLVAAVRALPPYGSTR